MEVTFKEMKELMDTLPVGYYAKRRVVSELSPTEEGTYYNMVDDKFIVSFSMIANTLKTIKCTDESKKELILRSLYYHELSHAILTPQIMKVDKIKNIFEDERIETLLSNFYYGVDFKENIKLINNFQGETPTTGDEYFYQVVRYRIGEKSLVEEVDDIIRSFRYLNRNSRNRWRLNSYEYKIKDFYERCVIHFTRSSAKTIQKETQKGSRAVDLQNVFGDDYQNELKKTQGQPFHPDELIEKLQKEYFERNFNIATQWNNELYLRLETFFENYNKKNSGGSALNGYSGVFNPRTIAKREDYKFFERKVNARSSNTFGSFHLNLFIDESGSFEPNQNIVNQLIGCLIRLERKYQNFDFDVVFCGEGQRICKKDERILSCDNGNDLNSEIFQQYKKVQKPMTYNYNIVLFDGLATYKGQEKNFGAFNYNNCTVISDPDNSKAIKKYCTNARTIITTDYVNNLVDNICIALQKALN